MENVFPCNSSGTSAPGRKWSSWWTNKPILDALGDRELARANRDFLRGFYAMIKDYDEQLRPVFLTGVSRLAGIFSGPNSLRDIPPRFAVICNYTDAELDAVFAPELGGLDRDEIRRWCNGYNWRGADKVYNPFDIFLLFETREFEAHCSRPARRPSSPTFCRGAGLGGPGRGRRSPVGRRRRPHSRRDAAVPDRLCDGRRREAGRGRAPLPTGLPELRGEAQPERAPADDAER